MSGPDHWQQRSASPKHMLNHKGLSHRALTVDCDCEMFAREEGCCGEKMGAKLCEVYGPNWSVVGLKF